MWQAGLDLLNILEQSAFKARFIGGCVRDSLLYKSIHDIDIATTATPQETLQTMQQANIKTIATKGIAYGTVMVFYKGHTYEITTLRKEISHDGRYPVVKFTTDWQQDAARRDFTINALSQDINGKIYDYFTGKEDLENGMVRFIGVPEERIVEDYLRILRYFRFAGHFQKGKWDRAALEACANLKQNIKKLSGHRIQQEMAKMPYEQSLAMLQQTKVADVLFAGATTDLANFLYLKSIHASPPLILKLCCLLDNINTEMVGLWQLSPKQVLTAKLLYNHPGINQLDYKELLNLSYENYQLLVYYTATKEKTGKQFISQHLAEALAAKTAIMPLNGHDVKNYTDLSGKNIGKALCQARLYWLQQNQLPDKAGLITFINNLEKL